MSPAKQKMHASWGSATPRQAPKASDWPYGTTGIQVFDLSGDKCAKKSGSIINQFIQVVTYPYLHYNPLSSTKHKRSLVLFITEITYASFEGT